MKKNVCPKLVKAFSNYSTDDPVWGVTYPGMTVIKFDGDQNEYVLHCWAPWEIITSVTKYPDGKVVEEELRFTPDDVVWTQTMCEIEVIAARTANGGHNTLPNFKIPDTPKWKIALYKKLAKHGKGDKVFTYYKDNKMGIIFY